MVAGMAARRIARHQFPAREAARELNENVAGGEQDFDSHRRYGFPGTRPEAAAN